MGDIQELFSRFEDVKVLIIGDIMLDSYIYGDINRISPEAPVPILDKTEEIFKLGGAGNVALNVKMLGAEPSIIAYIGDDDYGKKIISLLEDADIESNLIMNSRSTTVKQRIISGNTHILRIDIEEKGKLSKFNKDVFRIYKKQISKADIVIMSDYNKGMLDSDNIKTLIEIAKKKKKMVIVDPKFDNYKEYRGVDLIKPNLKEAIKGMGFPSDTELSVIGTLMKTESGIDVDNVMITLSDKGIYWNGEEEFTSEPYPIELADPCGCGDTVISISAILKYLNTSEKELVEIANIAGSMVCEHFGVVQISNKELLERCQKLKLNIE